MASRPLTPKQGQFQDSKRRAAIACICPTCGALPKFLCVGTRGNVRTAMHRDRYAVSAGQVPA